MIYFYWFRCRLYRVMFSIAVITKYIIANYRRYFYSYRWNTTLRYTLVSRVIMGMRNASFKQWQMHRCNFNECRQTVQLGFLYTAPSHSSRNAKKMFTCHLCDGDDRQTSTQFDHKIHKVTIDDHWKSCIKCGHYIHSVAFWVRCIYYESSAEFDSWHTTRHNIATWPTKPRWSGECVLCWVTMPYIIIPLDSISNCLHHDNQLRQNPIKES